MPWGHGEDIRRNWRFIVIMIYLTVVAFGCAYGIRKSIDATDQLHRQATTFASQQCESSNDARKVVYDLLARAETVVKKTPVSATFTMKQKHNAIKFYEDSQMKIVFSKCPPPLP